jgi:hypothetical protein
LRKHGSVTRWRRVSSHDHYHHHQLGVEQMTSLHRWDRSGIITLSQRLFSLAAATACQDDDVFDEASFGTGRFVIEDDRLIFL